MTNCRKCGQVVSNEPYYATSTSTTRICANCAAQPKSTNTLKSQLAQTTQLLEQEQAKVQSLREQLTTLQQTQEQNEQSLIEKQKELETELTQSKSSTASLRREIEELKKQLQDNKTLHTQVLQAEQDKLRTTAEQLANQIAANQQKEQTISTLGKNLKASETTLKKAQEQLQASQSKITTLEASILTHQQLKDKYEKELKAAREKTSQLETALQTENKTLKQTHQDQKQRILALEADKTDLIKQLAQAKEKWTKHLTATKQQIHQEIKLIKEVLK